MEGGGGEGGGGGGGAIHERELNILEDAISLQYLSQYTLKLHNEGGHPLLIAKCLEQQAKIVKSLNTLYTHHHIGMALDGNEAKASQVYLLLLQEQGQMFNEWRDELEKKVLSSLQDSTNAVSASGESNTTNDDTVNYTSNDILSPRFDDGDGDGLLQSLVVDEALSIVESTSSSVYENGTMIPITSFSTTETHPKHGRSKDPSSPWAVPTKSECCIRRINGELTIWCWKCRRWNNKNTIISSARSTKFSTTGQGLRIHNHLQASNTRNASFLEMLESRYITAELDDRDVYLYILGRCDLATLYNNVISRVFQGHHKLRTLSEVSRLVWCALIGTMAVVSHAKNNTTRNESASISQKFASTDASNCPLSATIRAFANDKADASKQHEQLEDKDPIAKAASKATHKYEGSYDWTKYALFSQPIQNSLGNLALTTAAVRVLSMFTLNSLGDLLSKKEREKLDRYKPYCEDRCSQQVGEKSLAWIFDTIIVPVINDASTSLDNQMTAFQLSELIFSKLSSVVAVDAFETVEAVPALVLFEDCSHEDRMMYKEKQTNGYLCERDSDGKLMKVSQPRRRLSCNLLLRSLCEGRVSEILIQYGRVEEAKVLSFGHRCMPPFVFSRSKAHSLLFDIQIYQDSSDREEYIESLVDGPVNLIKKDIHKVIDAYEKATVFADVTSDLQKGTQETYMTFVQLFEHLVVDNEDYDGDSF